jgi:hypothetical protein
MSGKRKKKESSGSVPANAESDDFVPITNDDKIPINSESRRVLASIVLDRLRKQDIAWIRVTNPSASFVMDVQIGNSNRIDAYQIKWSEWAGNLTLEDLTTDSDEDSALISQLAIGWKQLKQEFNLPVFVNLTTNDLPSATKLKNASRADQHLAKFLAIEWKRNRDNSGDWAPVWNAIEDASGLSGKEFNEFVKHCKINCSYSVPAHDESDEQIQPYHWVQNIYEKLFAEDVFNHDVPLELNQAEILDLLGWREDSDSTSGTEQDNAFAFIDDAPKSSAVEINATTPGRTDLPEEETALPEHSSEMIEKASSESVVRDLESQNRWRDLAQESSERINTKFAGAKSKGSTKTEESALKTTGKLRQMMGSRSDVGAPNPRSEDSGAYLFQTDLEEHPGYSGGAATDAGLSNEDLAALAWLRDNAPPQKDVEPRAATDSNSVFAPEPESAFAPESDGAFAPEPESVFAPEPESAFAPEQESAFAAEPEIFAPEENKAESTDNAEITGQSDYSHVLRKGKSKKKKRDIKSDTKVGTDVKLVTNTESDTTNGDTSGLDNFAKVSILAGKQDKDIAVADTSDEEDEEIKAEAFEWYFANGNELFRDGRFEEAEPEYARALEILQKLGEHRPDEEFTLMENLGDIYTFIDRPDKAVALYEMTRNVRFSAKIPISKYVSALLKHGSMQEDKGQFNEAEAQYRKAIEVAVESLSKDDPLVERANEACLRVARNRATFLRRFDVNELENLKKMGQDSDVAIMYRRVKKKEGDEEKGDQSSDIWIDDTVTGKRKVLTEETSKKTNFVLLCASIGVLFLFAFVMFVPAAIKPHARLTTHDWLVGTFKSADERKVIELAKDGRAVYRDDGVSEDTKYKFLGSSFSDLLSLLPGHLRYNYIFLEQRDKAALFDSEGTYLYSDNAPEMKIIKAMWTYSRLAERYRNEKRAYPETSEAWASASFGAKYENPYTNREDAAEVVAARGVYDSELVRKIGAGDTWIGQPEPRKGLIVCNTFSKRLMFIRGYDGDGKLITSSEIDPTTGQPLCFFIEMRDGVNVTTKNSLKYAADGLQFNKQTNTVMIFAKGTAELMHSLAVIKTLMPSFLIFLVVLALGLWRHAFNRDKANALHIVFLVASAVLLCSWFLVAVLEIS